MKWSVVIPLGITQTIGYGSLYYAFAVLAGPMASDTGLSLTFIYGLFSAGLFAGGIVAPFAGRMLDRFDPTRVMAAGSVCAAAVLAFWSTIPGVAAFVGFAILSQTVSVVIQYEAAFVAAARLVPRNARNTITGITLIAGFASTIFWPLTLALVEHVNWRTVYLIYAALNLAVCCPLHLFLSGKGLKARLDLQGDADRTAPQPVVAEAGENRRVIFVLLLVGFSANAYVIAAVHLNLIGILGAIGLGSSAAVIGAMIGPSQVAGRVLELASGGRIGIMTVSLVAAGTLPLALLLLAAGAPNLAAGFGFAALFGIGQGLSYIVRGVLPLHMFGPAGYGTLMGKFNLARLFVAAGAPVATAAIFEHGGAEAALTSILAAAVISVAGLAAAALFARRGRPAGAKDSYGQSVS